MRDYITRIILNRFLKYMLLYFKSLLGDILLRGLNHITIVVKDLDKSFEFYTKLLGMKKHAKWNMGAYLSLGDLWFCLNVDKRNKSSDSSHISFDISKNDFEKMKNMLLKNDIEIWKENKSEGESLYFLDPDNHKLEIHVGSLQSRLNSLKINPFEGLIFY